MPPSGSYKKAKTFYGKLGKLWLLTIVFFLIAGWLIGHGWWEMHQLYTLNPRLDPTYRFPHFIEIGIGILILAAIGAAIATSSGLQVTVTPDSLQCQRGKAQREVSWREVTVLFPPSHKRSGRHMIVSDGKGWTYRIDEMLFPKDFDLMLDLFQMAIKSRTTGEIEI